MAASSLVAIVDDDEGVRKAVSNLARSAGYAVRLFASAEDFLADETCPRPDCLLTDIQMPGMNGLELQAAVRAGPASLPILMMTAFPELAIQELALAGGALCILSKPFDAETLLSYLARATGQEP